MASTDTGIFRTRSELLHHVWREHDSGMRRRAISRLVQVAPHEVERIIRLREGR